MLKIGDKLYCHNIKFPYLFQTTEVECKKYEYYIVKKIVKSLKYFFIEDINHNEIYQTFFYKKQPSGSEWYYKNYFITLKKLRKQKLEKLKEYEI